MRVLSALMVFLAIAEALASDPQEFILDPVLEGSFCLSYLGELGKLCFSLNLDIDNKSFVIAVYHNDSLVDEQVFSDWKSSPGDDNSTYHGEILLEPIEDVIQLEYEITDVNLDLSASYICQKIFASFLDNELELTWKCFVFRLATLVELVHRDHLELILE